MIIFQKQWSLAGFYKEVNGLYLTIEIKNMEREKEHWNGSQDIKFGHNSGTY